MDLGQYNSVNSAQDIAHLTEALGYTDGYDLYGTSYGTRLAQYAMRTTPDRIRSVVLDGVSGASIPNVMWTFAKRLESYVALFEQCAADAACDAAYPDLATRFGALFDKLAEDAAGLRPAARGQPPADLRHAAGPEPDRRRRSSCSWPASTTWCLTVGSPGRSRA